MRNWRVWSGVLLGLLAAFAVFPAARPARAERGRLLSDCDGAIRELVIQYIPEAAAIVATAYRDFLRQLPPDRTVWVVCPDAESFDDLRARVGPVACRLEPVTVGHTMTCWSRDRWLAVRSLKAGAPTTLLAPKVEDGEEIWPQRAGDRLIAEDLARSSPGLVARRSPLAFDGGDFAADSESVFVASRVAPRNGTTSPETRATLRAALGEALGLEVILLDRSPDYHAGMYLMPVGDRTVLVGDPVPGPVPGAERPDRAAFDAVAAQCAAEGYRVIRIPVVAGADGRTYLTYLNVVIDEEAGQRVVYMPTYRNVPELNDTAEKVWRALGYEVRRVDCTETYPHFGSLRCLVNITDRSGT